MADIKIRAYKKEDRNKASEILNELFHPLIKGFVNVSFEQGPKYIRDFSIVQDKEPGLYVITVDEEVSGLLKLKSNEFNRKHEKTNAVKEYKFWDRIKTNIMLLGLDVDVKEHEMYVEYLVIDPAKRRTGLASKLLNFGLKLAIAKKKEVYFLNVLDNNNLGLKLYKRFGFTNVSFTKYPRYIAKRIGASKDERMEIKIDDFIIRRATKEDIEPLLELSTHVTNHNSRKFLGDERVDKFLASPYFTSEITDQINNMVVLTHLDNFVGLAVWNENELITLMIDPKYQGNGMATYYHNDMVKVMLNNYDELKLECFRVNARANRFYQKLGWELKETYFDEELELDRNIYTLHKKY